MESSLVRVLSFALIPVAATVIGGVIAAFRPPSERVRSYVQHFAAGVVFAAVAGELLPGLHDRTPRVVIVGFALGVGLMLAVQWVTSRAESEGSDERTDGVTGLIVTVGIDVLIDGVLIGVAFAAGTEKGLIVTIALTIELLFLGLAVAATLPPTTSKVKVIGATAGIGGFLLIGAAAGAVLFGGLTGPPLAVVIAFGAAVLLYLVTEELLVEAHEVPETLGSTGMFFVGFLVLFLIEML